MYFDTGHAGFLTEAFLESKLASLPHQVSLTPIRATQDATFMDAVQHEIVSWGGDFINVGVENAHKMFYATSDFMFGEEGNVHLMELNGAGSRGLQVLPLETWRQLVHNVVDMALCNIGASGSVLICHVDNDALLVEKEVLAHAFRMAGWHVFMYPYSMLEQLNPWDYDLVLSDGVTRRIGWNHDLANSGLWVGNMFAWATDAKLKTYDTVAEMDNLPSSFRLLAHEQANNFEELLDATIQIIAQHGAATPKFANGSGGAGVRPIFAGWDVRYELQQALSQYYQKMGMPANPWPATAMQLCYPPHLGDFGYMGLRAFDTRVYVSMNSSGVILPVGVLFRLGNGEYVNHGTREEFVTNLTGYGGLEVSRGLGLSEQSLAETDLTFGQIVEASKAAVTMFANLVRSS